MCAQRRHARKGRPRNAIPNTLPDDLYDYADGYDYAIEPLSEATPAKRLERRVKTQRSLSEENLTVVDDWPEQVPVTEAEIRVFERWFGDVFDELFGVGASNHGLKNLSQSDKKKP